MKFIGIGILGDDTSLSDITSVTAGTGLSGGGASGAVTLNVSGLTVSEIAAGSILVAGETFADNDTSLMSAAAINDRIESFGYTTNTGDITGVTAGVGLSGGGASGAVTLTLGLSELSDVTPASGDKLATLDADGGDAIQLTTVDSLATLFAGGGLSADGGVIGIDPAQTGITSVYNASLKVGRDTHNLIDFSTDNKIFFRASDANQIVVKDGIIEPVTTNDIDLGAADKEFKDAYFDGTVTSDAFAGPLTGNVTGNCSGTAATVTAGTQASITTLANVTTLGTIGTGTWQGTAIASAYLDADTAHYSATRQVTHHMITDDIDSDVIYISLLDSDAETSSATNKQLPFIAPTAGKLLKIFLRTSVDYSSETFTWKLYTRTVSSGTGGAPSEIGAQSGAGPTNKTMVTYDFTTGLDSGTNAIAAGDKVQISIEAGDGATANGNYFITCMWEWDLS